MRVSAAIVGLQQRAASCVEQAGDLSTCGMFGIHQIVGYLSVRGERAVSVCNVEPV